MLPIFAGIFLVLHGLVPLLYAGQSGRFFKLRPGMTWPDGSWLFSKFPGGENTRILAIVSLAITALGFVIGGVGLLTKQEWWRPSMVGAAIFSSVIFILLWDGKFQALDDKGGVSLLISLAVLVAIQFFKWNA